MNMIERSTMVDQFRFMIRNRVSTPLGMFHFVASEVGVIYAGWEMSEEFAAFVDNRPSHPDAINHAQLAKTELSAYFVGELRDFTVPIVVHGTEFQEQVWSALRQIPYGTTCSYRDVAEAVLRPRAVRAIGQANRANRTAVMIPCHRVIGANGALVGYAGSQTDLKAFLLKLEQDSLALPDRKMVNLIG